MDESIAPTSSAPKRTPWDTDEYETGWQRIKSIFTSNEYGESSPEFDFICKGITSSFLTSGVFGALLAANEAKINFIKKNRDRIYEHEYLAKRRYIDNIIIAASKHGFSWAWRSSLFVGSFLTITTAMSVYKNEVCVHHFSTAAAITGGLFRWHMGPKGVFAASLLGGALGTGAGIIIVGAMWITGTSMEEMRYYHYDHWQRELRMKKEEMKMKKRHKDENIAFHDNLLKKAEDKDGVTKHVY